MSGLIVSPFPYVPEGLGPGVKRLYSALEEDGFTNVVGVVQRKDFEVSEGYHPYRQINNLSEGLGIGPHLVLGMKRDKGAERNTTRILVDSGEDSIEGRTFTSGEILCYEVDPKLREGSKILENRFNTLLRNELHRMIFINTIAALEPELKDRGEHVRHTVAAYCGQVTSRSDLAR